MRFALFASLALAVLLATASAQDNSTSGAVEFKEDLHFDMSIDREFFQFAFVNSSSVNASNSSSDADAHMPETHLMVRV